VSFIKQMHLKNIMLS